MPETQSKSRPSGEAIWTWTIAITCLIVGALFFPTPFPLGVPFVALGLLILAPRLPWARRKFVGLLETYPRLSARVLKNPPVWLERRLAEAGISIPSRSISSSREDDCSREEAANAGRNGTRAEPPPRPATPTPSRKPA